MTSISKTIRISCDDACASDVRLAELCTELNIELMFYWPIEWHSLAYAKGYKPLSFDEAEDLADDFEIGSHTISHPLLTQIAKDHAEYEIEECANMLELLFGAHPLKFAPPRGYITPELKEYAMGLYTEVRLTKGEGLVHIHPQSGANDNMPWRTRINDNTKELWCHSWELDKYNLWGELEELLREIAPR